MPVARGGDRPRGARERQWSEEVEPHLGFVPRQQLRQVAARAFGRQPALALGLGRLRLQRALQQVGVAALGAAAREYARDVAELPLALGLGREQHGQRQRHDLRHHQPAQQQAHDLPRERRTQPAARGTLGFHGAMLARTAGDVTPAWLDLCIPIFFSQVSALARGRAMRKRSSARVCAADVAAGFHCIAIHCSACRGFGRGQCAAYDALPDPP